MVKILAALVVAGIGTGGTVTGESIGLWSISSPQEQRCDTNDD